MWSYPKEWKQWRNSSKTARHVGKWLAVQRQRYCMVRIHINNINKLYTIHRLLALTYIPNPNAFPIINHKNGNKHDNRLTNLEWCTYSQNMKHAYKNGLVSTKGEKSSGHKLTNKKVKEIRRLHENGVSNLELGDQFEIDSSTISRIVNRYTWTHI